MSLSNASSFSFQVLLPGLGTALADKKLQQMEARSSGMSEKVKKAYSGNDHGTEQRWRGDFGSQLPETKYLS